jgi:hypothetical protein
MKTKKNQEMKNQEMKKDEKIFFKMKIKGENIKVSAEGTELMLILLLIRLLETNPIIQDVVDRIKDKDYKDILKKILDEKNNKDAKAEMAISVNNGVMKTKIDGEVWKLAEMMLSVYVSDDEAGRLLRVAMNSVGDE